MTPALTGGFSRLLKFGFSANKCCERAETPDSTMRDDRRSTMSQRPDHNRAFFFAIHFQVSATIRTLLHRRLVWCEWKTSCISCITEPFGAFKVRKSVGSLTWGLRSSGIIFGNGRDRLESAWGRLIIIVLHQFSGAVVLVVGSTRYVRLSSWGLSKNIRILANQLRWKKNRSYNFSKRFFRLVSSVASFKCLDSESDFVFQVVALRVPAGVLYHFVQFGLRVWSVTWWTKFWHRTTRIGRWNSNLRNIIHLPRILDAPASLKEEVNI